MICIKRKIIDEAKEAIDQIAYNSGGRYEPGFIEGTDITEYVAALHRLINAADGMTAVGRRRKTPLCP